MVRSHLHKVTLPHTEMPQTQQQLDAMRQRNLVYFRQHHPDIHAKIAQLPSSPEYRLVLRKNQYFDIGHAATRQLIYNDDPADLATRSLKFICKTRGNYLEFQRETGDTDEGYPEIEALDQIAQYVQRHALKGGARGLPRKIICFGVGLGFQVQRYAEIETLEALLLIEPNLEFFLFSTLFVDYGAIAEKVELFFCVGDDLFGSFFEFLRFKSEYNFSVKLHLLLQEYRYLADQAQRYLSHRPEFHFERRLANAGNIFSNTLNYLQLDLSAVSGPLSAPALLLASGPSLEKNIALIKQAQERFLVCCVGSCLKKLLQENITVDICFTLDPKPRIIEQFQGIPDERLKQILFISSSQTDIRVNQLFPRVLVLDKADYEVNTVAHFALYVLCHLGLQEIHAIGIDAALSDQLEEYAKDVVFKADDIALPDERPFTTKGNLRATVMTNAKLSMYIGAYTRMAKESWGGKIYNLSDGAYLDGLIPLNPEDWDPQRFQPVSKAELLKQFKAMDKRAEAAALQERLAAVPERLLKLVRTRAKQIANSAFQIKSVDEYIAFRAKNLLVQFSVTCEQDPYLTGIVQKYLFTTDCLILYLLDHQDLTDFRIHAKELYREWICGLENIMQIYRGFLGDRLPQAGRPVPERP